MGRGCLVRFMRSLVITFAIVCFGLLVGCQQVPSTFRVPLIWREALRARLESPEPIRGDEGVATIEIQTASAAMAVAEGLDRIARKAAVKDDVLAQRAWRLAAYYFSEARRLAPEDVDVCLEAANALTAEAAFLAKTEQDAAHLRWREAYLLLESAHRLDPQRADVLNNWGLGMANEAAVIAKMDLSRARKQWALAREKYAAAIAIDPDKHGSFNNWGISLDSEADAVAADDYKEAQALWRQSREKFERSLSIKPDKAKALSNIGASYGEQAKFVATHGVDDDAVGLWELAVKFYRRALAVNPDYRDARFGLGITYLNRAKMLKDEDVGQAREYWASARRQFLKAALVSREDGPVASEWARSFELEARSAEDLPVQDQLHLWEEAITHSRTAIAYAPLDDHGYIVLGNALEVSARLLYRQGEREDAIGRWDESERAYRQALDLRPSFLAANNICIARFGQAEVMSQMAEHPEANLWSRSQEVAVEMQHRFPEEPAFHRREALSYIAVIDGIASLDSEEKWSLLKRAEACYEAGAVRGGLAGAYLSSWGDCLFRQYYVANGMTQEARRDILLAALAKFKEAHEAEPRSSSFLHNVALAYNALADSYHDSQPMAAKVYRNMAEPFAAEALALDPDAMRIELLLLDIRTDIAAARGAHDPEGAHAAFDAIRARFAELNASGSGGQRLTLGWGEAMGKAAVTLWKSDPESAAEFWDAAEEVYGRAINPGTDQQVVMTPMILLLQERASKLAGSGNQVAAREYWGEMRAYAERILEQQPDSTMALGHIGLGYLREYSMEVLWEEEPDLRLLEKAEHEFLKAESIDEGAAAYNLACVASWREQPEACVGWLELSRRAGTLPHFKFLLRDPFLKEMFKREAVRVWMREHFPEAKLPPLHPPE